MSIANKFPIRESVLTEGKSREYTSKSEASKIGLGVLLNRSSVEFDWLDVTYAEGQVDISLNLTERGKSFVTERTSIAEGETEVFGKIDRPWMNNHVSRRHVGVAAVKGGVVVTDLHSTNGTSIWVPSQFDGEGREGAAHASSKKEQHDANGEIDPELIKIDMLQERHAAEFPDLEQVDYGILSTMVKSHPDALSSRKEKLKVITLIHPDRNITGNEKRSHQLYILALKVLDIHL